MTKNRYFRLILILFLIFIPLIITLPTLNGKIIRSDFNSVKSENESIIVFSFSIHSTTTYDFLTCDEFAKDAQIENFGFAIHYHPEKANITSVKTTLTSPTNIKFEHSWSNIEWIPKESGQVKICQIPFDHFPSKFNETGIWYLEFSFNVNKSLDIWEFEKDPTDFHQNSQIRTFYPYKTSNYYKKGITVYSQTELTYVRAAKASEETSNLYNISIWILGATAIATSIAAILSFYNVKESLKDKKIEGIKHMIQTALKPATYEFENFHNLYEQISNDKFHKLPTKINKSIINTAQWKDLKIELYYSYFSRRKLQNYLAEKENYNNLRKNLSKEIINSTKVKRLSINKSYEVIAKLRNKSKSQMTPKNFFEKKILNKLSESIITKENSDNEIANELFNKFKQKWLEIRDEKPIKDILEKLKHSVSNMRKYNNFHKTLKFHMDTIMEKYRITYWELEKHTQELKKEGFETKYIYPQEYGYQEDMTFFS